MTKEVIFERIKAVIQEQLERADFKVTKDMSLRDDLGVDSIGLTEFIINLEDEFKLSIPDDDVEKLTTMADLVDYIDSRLIVR